MASPETSTWNEQQGNDSRFKGVRKRKWGKWVSEIRLPNSRERIWLGSYDSPEKAARAFDAAQFCLRGPGANFNFPDSLPEIDDAQSLSPHQIQIASAKYANEPDSQLISREDDGLSAGGNLQAVACRGNWVASSSSSSSTAMSERSVNISEGEMRIDWSFVDALYTNDNGGYPAFPQSPLMPEQTLQENEDTCMEEIFPHQPLLWNFDR